MKLKQDTKTKKKHKEIKPMDLKKILKDYIENIEKTYPKTGKIINILRISIFEPSVKNRPFIEMLQVIWYFLILFFMIPMFFVYTWVTAIFIRFGIEKIFANSSYNFDVEIKWMIYGFMLGIAISIVLQCLPKKDQSPYQFAMTLIRYWGWLLLILSVCLAWIGIVLISGP